MIADHELRRLAAFGSARPMPVWYYREIFGMELGRKVTDEEALNAITRINGPADDGGLQNLTRSTDSAWRSRQ